MIRHFRFIVIILALLTVSCRDQHGAPASAPSNFTVTSSDSQVVLTWDAQPGQIYAVYYRAGSTVDTANYDNTFSPITSPFTITNLTNQTQYAFIINASSGGSEPGPSTPVVTATPGIPGTGTSWTIGFSITPNTLRWVAFGGNNFVAVGDGTQSEGGVIFSAQLSNSSSSGITNWSPPQVNPIPANVGLTSVIYNGSLFAALAGDGEIITSPDTVTWTSGTTINSAGNTMNSIAYGANAYVAVGDAGTIETNLASNQTATITGPWATQVSGVTDDLYGVSYVNGTFFAVGKEGVLLTSPNGVNWTTRIASSVNSKNLYQVAYGAGTYVAVGDAGTILTSTDTQTWTPQTAPTGQNLYGICFGSNGQFVAVGAAGTVAYSSTAADGSWAVLTVGIDDLNNIDTSGGEFVAVGSFGANVSGR